MLLFFYNFSLFLFDFVQLLWNLLVAAVQSIVRVFIKPTKVSLEAETVLITGAGQGIGRAIALEFAKRKANKIILWDINKEETEKTANELRKEGARAYGYLCDVTDRRAVQTVAKQVFTEVGNPTILVNNAGICPVQPFTKLNHQQLARTMEVNVLAHFWTMSEFLPRMMEMGHGHIVAIASAAGKIGTPYLIPYTASKYAVAGLMESLTAELRELNYYPDVFATTVFPNIVNTTLVKNPRIRFQSLYGLIEPEEVASRVVDGVQRKEEYVFVPGYFEYIYRFLPMIPRKVYFQLMDFLDTGLDPQD